MVSTFRISLSQNTSTYTSPRSVGQVSSYPSLDSSWGVEKASPTCVQGPNLQALLSRQSGGFSRRSSQMRGMSKATKTTSQIEEPIKQGHYREALQESREALQSQQDFSGEYPNCCISRRSLSEGVAKGGLGEL